MELDLADLRSVKEFVMNVKEQYKVIDILINNAGVAYPTDKIHLTKDNMEVHFAVNHLGHFYLTNLLLGMFKKASRIIIVSSSLHERGTIDLDNIEKGTEPIRKLYANSKLANIYFGQELVKRTKAKNIEVYVVSPGFVFTSLSRFWIKWYHYIIFAPIAYFFLRTPKQGCQTTVYCATEPNLEKQSSLLYRNCVPYQSKYKFDEDTASKLWIKSELLVNQIMQ